MDLKEIISIVVAVIVGLTWALLELRRWRKGRLDKKIEEDNLLAPNPTRCADHESRLRSVEVVCTQYKTGHEDLVRRVDEVGGDVKTLLRMHLKE